MSIHEGFETLAAEAIDFDLDEYERAELDRHLAMCAECRRSAAAFRDDAAAIASEAGPSLAPGRSAAILANVLRPRKSSPPLRLLAVAALLAIFGAGVGVAGMQFLGRLDDPNLAVASPSPSSTPGLPSASIASATASPAATPQPTTTTSPDPGSAGPTDAPRPLVRGSAREFGTRIRMAPTTDGNLYVSTPGPDGVLLALLDGSGRSQPGWPIKVKSASSCADPMVAADGSVRIVCDGTDLPKFDNDVSDVRAFAFDAAGRSMAGWPVQLRPGIGRVNGNELTVFASQYITDTYDIGTVSHTVWVTTVAADGSIRTGAKVPMVESCCIEKWAIGPNGVAYGVRHVGATGPPKATELVAVGPAGIPLGFPVTIEGVASTPAFDADRRIHVTVASVIAESSAHGPARTRVFDTEGRAVAGGSPDLGLVASDTCAGIEGTCEGPAAPLVGVDGTTFVIEAGFQRTIAARVLPSGDIMRGWPYRSEDEHQAAGFCAANDICEAYDLARPAIGPDNVLYLIHRAASASTGGKIVAVGPDGRVVAGWPVRLRRAGAAFWSVVVGADGTVYALAIEPEPSDRSSATILGIAPDSTVRYTTTIVDP